MLSHCFLVSLMSHVVSSILRIGLLNDLKNLKQVFSETKFWDCDQTDHTD